MVRKIFFGTRWERMLFLERVLRVLGRGTGTSKDSLETTQLRMTLIYVLTVRRSP